MIAVSAGMRADTLDSYADLDPAKVHVVKNGIDPRRVLPRPRDRGRLRARNGARPAVRRLRGSDHPAEGPDPPGAGRRAARPPTRSWCCWPAPPDTPEIAQQISEAFAHLQRSRGHVLWIEQMLPRAQVRQVLSHATVFACPSVYEPLGIVEPGGDGL